MPQKWYAMATTPTLHISHFRATLVWWLLLIVFMKLRCCRSTAAIWVFGSWTQFITFLALRKPKARRLPGPNQSDSRIRNWNRFLYITHFGQQEQKDCRSPQRAVSPQPRASMTRTYPQYPQPWLAPEVHKGEANIPGTLNKHDQDRPWPWEAYNHITSLWANSQL